MSVLDLDKTREYSRRGAKAYRDRLRKLVIDAYGGKCVCCGETIFAFLVLDHVNGGGTAERRTHGGRSIQAYRDARNRGYPPDYQVLCHNCNHGRAINDGVCPHMEL